MTLREAIGKRTSIRCYDGRPVDVGIAMSHFFLAAKEMGWKGSWQVVGFNPYQIIAERGIPEGHEVPGVYNR